QKMKAETKLNCSVGIAASRLVAKISSDQAKPNGVLWVMPGREAAFLAPLDVRKVPGVGKVTEKNLHSYGIRKVGDLARLDEKFLEERFGKWGMALAGKSRGLDAGGWFDTEIGEDVGPKSISHEHTFGEDTADAAQIESTLARLCEMVGRRLREHGLYAGTVQLKLRNSAFETITRAHSPARATQLDTELYAEVRELFRKNWTGARGVRHGRGRESCLRRKIDQSFMKIPRDRGEAVRARRRKMAAALSLCAAIVLTVGQTIRGADEAAPNPAPMLKQYCFQCHG